MSKKETNNVISVIRGLFSCITSTFNVKQRQKLDAPAQNEHSHLRKHTLLTSATTSTTTTSTNTSTASDLEKVFHFFDENGDGKISVTELQSCMRSMGEEMAYGDVLALMQSVDTDGDGLLGFDDFVRLIGTEEEEEKGKNLREAFSVYEMEGEECITPKSLSRALGKLGEPKSIEECTIMIRRFDINGDGVISFDEFKIMML